MSNQVSLVLSARDPGQKSRQKSPSTGSRSEEEFDMTKNLLASLARKALAVSAALAVSTFASGALGADLPQRSSPVYYAAPPVFTWTGFYFGANGGYGFGRSTFGGGNEFGDQFGGLIGVTAGYNYQSG